MARKMESLIGRRFDRLIVVEYIGSSKNRQSMWKCRCDCGKESVVRRDGLVNGKVLSCGCKQREIASTHGMSKHRLYRIWQKMTYRCHKPGFVGYENYGGRGIYVCDKWRNDSYAFMKWCLDNGWKSGLQIDRINNEEEYCPENCRIVTAKENCRNKRNNHILTFNGRSLCISEWAEITGISKLTIRSRILRGWSVEDILTKPVRKRSAR